jgi:hypothetical protein
VLGNFRSSGCGRAQVRPLFFHTHLAQGLRKENVSSVILADERADQDLSIRQLKLLQQHGILGCHAPQGKEQPKNGGEPARSRR